MQITLGATAPGGYGSGGCPLWSKPYSNVGGEVCDAAGNCVPGGSGCVSIFQLYPIYFMIGGASLLLLLLMGGMGRR